MVVTPNDRRVSTTYEVDECSACGGSHIDLIVKALANGSGHFYICPRNGDPALVDRSTPSSSPEPESEPEVREYAETGVVELSGDAAEATSGTVDTLDL